MLPATSEAFIILRGELLCSLLTDVRVVCYQSSCRSCSHITILFQFVVSNINFLPLKKKRGDLYRIDVVESKYGNQIVQSQTILDRDAYKVKNYICFKTYTCQCRSHQGSTLWTQNKNGKRLQQKLREVRGKNKIFFIVRYSATLDH